MPSPNNFQCTEPRVLTTWLDWGIVVPLYEDMVAFNVIHEGELLSAAEWVSRLARYCSVMADGFKAAQESIQIETHQKQEKPS